MDLGADFLGLNFYEKSPRFVNVERAREIAAAVAGDVSLVGVFVNAAPTTVETIAEDVGLELLQFHGDEAPAQLEPFSARAIKVLRLGAVPGSLDLEQWPRVWGFLVEGHHPTLYGGSGREWAYEMMKDLPQGRRIFAAGGLTPANVGDAVRRSRAWGVDVCSGVEAFPGIKDRKLLEMFFDEVRRGEG